MIIRKKLKWTLLKMLWNFNHLAFGKTLKSFTFIIFIVKFNSKFETSEK